MDGFLRAAYGGDLARVQELLPGVEEERRVRALSGAIANGQLGVAEFLLAAGVPPAHDSCANSSPGYPLHAAAEADDPRAVALLLEAGAQPDVFSKKGNTPLRYARSAPVARMLLDAGADVNAGNWLPLGGAAFHGREDVLRALLAHPGVDVHRGDQEFKWSPLHCAVEGGSPGCVAALLAAGADPCALDGQRRTPLAFVALHRGVPAPRNRIATLLVGAGARQWEYVPTPCPGLEAALVAVWKKGTGETAPRELAQLFRRLEPAVQAQIQATLRALHHGARPVGGLPEPLHMAVLEKVLE